MRPVGEGSSRDGFVQLNPTEQDRLLAFTTAQLAREMLARGHALNAPEAIGLVCDEMHLAGPEDQQQHGHEAAKVERPARVAAAFPQVFSREQRTANEQRQREGEHDDDERRLSAHGRLIHPPGPGPWPDQHEGDRLPVKRRRLHAQRPAALGPRAGPRDARIGSGKPVPERLCWSQLRLVQAGEREEWGPVQRSRGWCT